MGKGDKKTKRGKIIQGSYGIKRPRKPVKAYVAGTEPTNADKKAAKIASGEVVEVIEKAKKKVAPKATKTAVPELELMVEETVAPEMVLTPEPEPTAETEETKE